MAPSNSPTPDEELATITPEEIELLVNRFEEKVKANNADFYQDDLDRARNDKLWLRRFIAHSEFKIETATNMLYDTCQWRKEFGTNELDHTKLPENMRDKGILFIRNQDKWGKKLLIFKAKYHLKGVEDFENLKKYIVYYFERIERETKSDQISIIFDMKDTGWSNMDMDFIRYLITLLKQYYPFLVNYLMIFEMPWLLKSAWNIIKGWLPPKFVDRVKFVDKKSINDFIDVDNQLVDWGGNDAYVYSFEPELRGKAGTGTDEGNNKSRKVSAPQVTITNGNQDRAEVEVQHEEVQAQVRKRAPQIKSRTKALPPPIPIHPPPDSTSNGTSAKMEADVDSDEEDRKMATPALSRSPTPSTPEINRSSHISEEVGNAIPLDARSQLVNVDVVVRFEKENTDINGRFDIENVSQNRQTVIFKVKTTDPSKFRVRPTIGVLESETKATININVMEGVSLHHIARERFQVQVTVLPRELAFAVGSSVESENTIENRLSGTNFNQLNTTWKQIVGVADAYVETHRMTCRLDPSALLPNTAEDSSDVSSSSSRATISKEDTRRALDQMEQKITTTFNNTLNEKFDYIIKLIYGLFILTIFAMFFLWVSIPSTSRIVDRVAERIEPGNLKFGGTG